jgi:hypothetical protein
MSRLTRHKKTGASSVDDKLAKLESKRQRLLIDKQIQDLRAKKKDLTPK